MKALIYKKELICLLDRNNNLIPKNQTDEIFKNNKNFIKMKEIFIPHDTKEINLKNTYIEINTSDKKYKYNLNMLGKIKDSISVLKEFFGNVDIKANNLQKRVKIKAQARDYQETASNDILFYQKGIIYAPTGSGKTNIMCYTFSKNPTNTLIIVPSKELVKQTKARFLEVLQLDDCDVGIINSDVKNKTKEIKPLLITTWQSIKNEIKDLIKNNNYSTIFVDEAHHSSANVINSIIKELLTEKTRLYGFSATPYRTQEEDEKKIFNLFENRIITRIPIDYLYKKKFLVKPLIQIIQNDKNYSLNNIAKENFIRSLMEKKNKENPNNDDFINSIFKIPSFVLADKNLSSFITIEKSNKNIKASYSDLENAKNIFKKENLKLNDIKQILFNSSTSLLENKYIKLFKDCYRVYSDDFFNKNNSMKFYENFDFSQKIGFLKKSIDEDEIRVNKIFEQISNAIISTNKVNTIILANTINLFNLYKEKISNFLSDNKISMDFFCINGSSEKNLKAIKESNSYILLATTDFMREGIDLPNAQRLFCTSPIFPPFSPKYALEQIIGRVIRPYKDKEYAEIYVFDAFTSDFSAKRNEILELVNQNLMPDEFEIRKDNMFSFLRSKEKNISKINFDEKNKVSNSQIVNTPYLINYFIRDKNNNYFFYNEMDEKINIDNFKIKNIEEYKKLNLDDTQDECIFYLKNGFLSRNQLNNTVPNTANLTYSIKELEIDNFSNINKKIAKNIFKAENINVANELSHITDNKFLQQALKNNYIISFTQDNFNSSINSLLGDKIRYNESTNSFIYMCDNPYKIIKNLKENNNRLFENFEKANIIKIDKLDTNIDVGLFNFIISNFLQNNCDLLFEILKKTIKTNNDTDNKTIIESLKLVKSLMLTYNPNNRQEKEKIYRFLSYFFYELYNKNDEKAINQEKVKLLDEVYNLIPIEFKERSKPSYELLRYSFLGISYPKIQDEIISLNLDSINYAIDKFDIKPLSFKGVEFYKIDKQYLNTQDNYICIKDKNSSTFMTENDYIYNYQKKFNYPIFYKELDKTKEELEELLQSEQFIKIAEVENKILNERYIYVLDSFSSNSYRFTFDERTDEINKVQQYDYNIYAKLVSDASLETLHELNNSNINYFSEAKNTLESFLLTSPYNTNFCETNIKNFNELLSFFHSYELERFLKNNFTTQYIGRHLMTGFEDVKTLEKERFVKDLMFQLSSVNNFLGQYNYTTLQHCCNVSKIAVNLAKQDGISDDKLLKEVQIKALFHDAIELFISDIPTPIKESNPNLYKIEEKLNDIVYSFLGLKQNELDSYVARADKLERQTFIDMYMKNENLIEDSLMSFIKKMINDNVLADEVHIKNTAKLIINEYDKYLKNELTLDNLSVLTKKWIKSYRLAKESFGLSKKEINDLGLNLDLNRPQIEIVKDFCKIFNEVSETIQIEPDNLENELKERNNPQKNIEDIEYIIKKQVEKINLKIDEDIIFTNNILNKDNNQQTKINFKL